MWQLCTAQPQLLSPSYPASRYGTWKCTPLNRHILARPASRISIQRKQTAAALPGKTSTTTAKSNSNGSSSSSSSSTTHQQLGDVFTPAERETFDVVVIGAGIGGLSCAALLAYYGFKASVHCHLLHTRSCMPARTLLLCCIFFLVALQLDSLLPNVASFLAIQ
jgi:hypothetical protein